MSGKERAIQSIREKLHFARIRPETLVHLCEKEDKNNDELLNTHDLEDVLRDTLGPDTITQREMKYLTDSLALPSSKLRNSVQYKKMTDLLSATRESTVPAENWNGWNDGGNEFIEKTTRTKRGTIGDFLEHASCPAEQRNYKKLVSLLDNYEKESGMKIELSKNGFIIPLGPNMEAIMQVSLR